MLIGPFLSYRHQQSFVHHFSRNCAMLRRSKPWKVVAIVDRRPPPAYAACRICCRLPARGSRPGLRWPA